MVHWFCTVQGVDRVSINKKAEQERLSSRVWLLFKSKMIPKQAEMTTPSLHTENMQQHETYCPEPSYILMEIKHQLFRRQ